MSRKLTYSQVRQLDAEDGISHPMVRVQEPAFFTLAGAVALNTDLLRTLSDTPNACKRSEWRLACPMCQSFLGCWICAPGDVQLSSNQQRKNRNTLLLGKSHYHKFHATTSKPAVIDESDSNSHASVERSKLPAVVSKASRSVKRSRATFDHTSNAHEQLERQDVSVVKKARSSVDCKIKSGPECDRETEIIQQDREDRARRQRKQQKQLTKNEAYKQLQLRLKQRQCLLLLAEEQRQKTQETQIAQEEAQWSKPTKEPDVESDDGVSFHPEESELSDEVENSVDPSEPQEAQQRSSKEKQSAEFDDGFDPENSELTLEDVERDEREQQRSLHFK